MLKTVYASAQVLGHVFTPTKVAKGLRKQAQTFRGFEFEPREGYLYVSVRAVSARVNRNYDGFSAEELKRAYKTFEGRPVYVNHENTDKSRARGVIVASKLHDSDPSDVWVEAFMELDEQTYPKLCHFIRTGELDTVSMGCNIEYSACSVCGNKAYMPNQYCFHIQNKGVVYEEKTASGGTLKVLAYEDCRGVDFFEESWVFDPADSSAMTTALLNEDNMVHREAQNIKEIHRPDIVDTLREDSVCPVCGNENYDGEACDVCGHVETPESLGDADTDKAKDADLPVEKEEPKSVKDKSDDSKGSKDENTKKGGNQAMSRKPNIDAMRRRASNRRAQVGEPIEVPSVEDAGPTGEAPIQAPAETTVDVNPDTRIDFQDETIDAVPAAEVNEVSLPEPEPAIPSAVARKRRRAQVGTPVVEEGTPERQDAGVENPPYSAPAETTVDTSPDDRIDFQEPTIDAVPAAEVNEISLSEPEDPAPIQENQLQQEGGGSVQPSVTGQRVAFVRAYKLAETRVDMGLEVNGTDKTALADKLSRNHTVGEINMAQSVLEEVKEVSKARAATRGMVPRRASRKATPVFSEKTATSNVPDEAIFGLD